MILQIKADARPICDEHRTPMRVVTFVLDHGMTFTAHQCTVAGCTRIYQHGHGYHDAETGKTVSFERRLDRECAKCHATMFLAEVSPTAGKWQCGQIGCDYAEDLPITAEA
jgi:ribosomal protein S27AE